MDLKIYYGSTPWWKPRTRKMKIEIIEYKPTVLKFKVEGETHTIFNLLKSELLHDDDVAFAAYKVEHPLFDRIIFIIRTKEKDPLEIIRRVINRVRRKISTIRKNFERVFEEGVTNPPFASEKEWKKFIRKQK